MFTHGRRALQEPEGDNGGGGGEAPPAPPQAIEAPPAPDYAAIIAQQSQQMQQYQQQLQELMHRQQQAQPPQLPPEEEDYLDPAVKKQLDAIRRSNAEQSLQLQDQMDHQQFITEVRNQGFDNEMAQQATALHRRWVESGMRIGTQPPSRIDALVYLNGQQAVRARQTTRSASQQAEQARLAQNQDALLGVGARAARGAGTPVLDTMDRATRLSTGYAAVLDTEGF